MASGLLAATASAQSTSGVSARLLAIPVVRLLPTGGVSTIEGAGGGGLSSWALITGYGTDSQIGANVHYTGAKTRDYLLQTGRERHLALPEGQSVWLARVWRAEPTELPSRIRRLNCSSVAARPCDRCRSARQARKPKKSGAEPTRTGGLGCVRAYFLNKNVSISVAYVDLGEIVGALTANRRQPGGYLSLQVGF